MERVIPGHLTNTKQPGYTRNRDGSKAVNRHAGAASLGELAEQGISRESKACWRTRSWGSISGRLVGS